MRHELGMHNVPTINPNEWIHLQLYHIESLTCDRFQPFRVDQLIERRVLQEPISDSHSKC